MAVVRNSTRMFSRSVSFNVSDQVKSPQKKLSQYVMQRKTWPMPRLVLGNLSNDHEQGDPLKDNNQRPKLNESNQEIFVGSQSEYIAPLGRVEDTSLHYRPVFSDDLSSATLPDGWLPYEQAMRVLNARIESYKGMDVDTQGHFQKDFARYLNKVWVQKELAEKYYKQALAMEPQNPRVLGEYAEFSWMLMGNEEKAEELFNTALQEDPNDSIILGSYALFMWQRET